MDYSLLTRAEYTAEQLEALPQWDLFLSAFNQSERVNRVFEAVEADRKTWLIHPEYDFTAADLPTTGEVRELRSRDEAEFWREFFEGGGLDDVPPDGRVCIDITGFMRPHLMLLPRLLRDRGFSRLDVLYSDPVAYESDEETPFTKGAVTDVRQVRGFEGAHSPDAGEEDLLIIGSGYDDELIRRVAESKRAARKFQLFGLPSLQPHMYEENRLRAAKAEESVGPLPNRSLLFAPANDPFMTAQTLHDRVAAEAQRNLANLYLSPLATKAQALGFALFYQCECVGKAVSVIFPYAEFYSRETSVGLSRVSSYRLELDWFQL